MRSNRLAVLCALILSVAFPAMAQKMVPTNRPDVMAFPAPPPNFSFVTATPEQLQAYGLPPRPTDLQSIAMWDLMVGAATDRIIPEFKTTNRYHGPAKGASLRSGTEIKAGTIIQAQATNWSGQALINTRESNPIPFTTIVGLWAVPSVDVPTSTCQGLGYFASDWIGIDGAVNQNLVQDGTDSFIECNNGNPIQVYLAWWEWIPNPESVIQNFNVQSGDGMASLLQVVNSTHANILLIDLTTGFNVAFQVTAPQGAFVVGQSAEWIHEAVTVNGSVSPMPAFGIAYFSWMQANFLNSPTYPNAPGNASTLEWTCVQNGVKVAFPHLTGSAVQWILGAIAERDVLGD